MAGMPGEGCRHQGYGSDDLQCHCSGDARRPGAEHRHGQREPEARGLGEDAVGADDDDDEVQVSAELPHRDTR